jgi:nucleoside-diphosphate-sugar epimerase
MENRMRVLVTGHEGYIGCVLASVVQAAGHEVVGLDNGLFRECDFGSPPAPIPALDLDLREVEVDHLRGFESVIHLAGLSNDPVGDLSPQCTYAINHLASVRLARLAKQAGVTRFLFSSSCSLYGSAGEDFVNETAGFNPVTPYGESKILVEQDVSQMADDDFSPTFLRNATAYGVSPRLRADLAVNNLTGFAFLQGEVLLSSDGTPWRPLVHIQDISRVFLACLEAPRELVHNQSFNVGRTDENYQIRDVAEIVREIVPGSRVAFGQGASADVRDYRVDCSKLARTFPHAIPRWTVRQGAEELYEAYQTNRLTADDFRQRYVRIAHIRRLRAEEQLDENLQRTRRAAADK